MKCERAEKVTKVIEGSKLEINGAKINGKSYKLNIENLGNRLTLSFYDDRVQDSCEYRTTIDEKGIRFERHVHRPDHDHNDIEHLTVVVDSDRAHKPIGELVWRARFPYSGEGYDFFYVPFGGI